MTLIPVQGMYDTSSGQLLINISGFINNQGSFAPSQTTHKKESQEPFISQPSTFIRNSSLHFFCSVLGVVGSISFVVSCISSVLLPAVGSIGVIAIACLVKRKIVPLHTKKLPSEADKAQSVFQKRTESNTKTGKLPFAVNYLQPSPSPSKLETSQKDITNKISNPPAPPLFQEFPASPVTLQESSRNSSNIAKKQDPRKDFLSSIREGKSLKFNIENAERTLTENPEIYSSNLLLKELKSTYERALGISESEKSDRWKAYFTDKLENFEKNFKVKKEAENPMIENPMEDICKKAGTLSSILENMKWTKSLLSVLSHRKDLSKELKNYCSEKLNSIDKHMEELENCGRKRLRQAEKKESSNGAIEASKGSIVSLTDALLHVIDEKFPQEKTSEQRCKERYAAIHGTSSSESDSDADWE